MGDNHRAKREKRPVMTISIEDLDKQSSIYDGEAPISSRRNSSSSANAGNERFSLYLVNSLIPKVNVKLKHWFGSLENCRNRVFENVRGILG